MKQNDNTSGRNNRLCHRRAMWRSHYVPDDSGGKGRWGMSELTTLIIAVIVMFVLSMVADDVMDWRKEK